jgi:hypothetical protein
VVLLPTVVLALSGCETEIYYPVPLEPSSDGSSTCDGDVDGTVVVDNQGEHPVDVHELLPDGCTPSARGTVPSGESADLGLAAGRIWRVYDAETRERLGTFELEDGENVLVVP